jgi:hypothetical protein
MHCFLLIFAKKNFTFFSSMEGYSADGEIRDSQGQMWSQNSEWMRFSNPISLPPNHVPAEIPQLRFQHAPNLFSSHSSRYLSLSSPPFQRLPHSERELEEIGTQIPCSEFSRGKEILEVKKEEGKVPKSAPKKRGRPSKEKTVTKKAKTSIIDLEDMEDVEDKKTKWKDFEVETLIALRGEMDEEFARAANKQGKFFFP